jgi:GH25 family lysozyme M1 (1,4-beta-N-acetylmuramidase)
VTKTGADISHWQASLDPVRYKASGEDFLILKATEHTRYLDPTFRDRWAAARSADLPRGAYHFARPGTGTVDAQADHFIRTLRAAGVSADDTWALDMEDDGGKGAATLVAWAERFCDRVAAALGSPGLFYSNIPFIRSTMGNPGRVPGGCLAWIARYAAAPYQDPHPCPKGWPDPPDVWQCSDGINGCVKTVASIGKCDYNRMTDAAFAKLFGGGKEWWED